MDREPTYEELAQRVKELEQGMPQHKVVKEITTHHGKRPNYGIESKNTEGSDNSELDLESIINVEEIQSIMDDMYPLTNMLTAVMDLTGKVIISVGWQDICLNFHRKNPETAFKCRESDLLFAKNVKPGEFIEYKCKNGLWEVFTPLYVGTRHIGNVYTGQFFYDDAPIDEAFFIKQAEKYGFDKDAYLTALRKVPKFSREAIHHLMGYLIKFTTYVSRISFFNMQLENEIRERKQAENALKKSETHLRTLIRTIPDLVWLKDADGVYLSCNPRFESFFGAKEKDIIGKTDYDFVDKELADFFRKKDKVAMDNRKASINEEEIPFADDGHREILETIKTPIYGTDGALVGVLGIGRDITHRKQAENALRESEERFRLAFDNANVGVCLVDTTGKILKVNSRMCDIFGYSRSELESMTVNDIAYPEDKSISTKFIQSSVEGEVEASVFEKRYIHKNGKMLFGQVSSSVVKDEKGEPLYFISHVQDITERKHSEQLRTNLERQLRQAHKMEAIGTLAGGIAHEFNNVLAIILGNAELALDDVPDWNPAKESLKEIRIASFRAKEVVQQILSFARKTTKALKPLEINTIVKESLKLMRASIPTMVDIQSSIPSEPKIIQGDPTEIHQIVINLCTNASHAMKETGGTLEVGISEVSLDEKSTSPYEDLFPGYFVMLTVKDSGEGIAADVLEKVFEPYFTTKAFGAGSGMGLAVVYGIVKKSKGAINIVSTAGEGTTVEVLFPRIEEEAPPVKKAEGEFPTGNERVLLVDDDPSIVNMIRQLLERMGYTVTGLTDSTTALERFKSAPDDFDLVVTDMSMPKMSGAQLAAELMKTRKDIPILLCTGHSDTVDEKKAKQLGIRGFAMKPLDKGKLARALSAVLDKNGGG